MSNVFDDIGTPNNPAPEKNIGPYGCIPRTPGGIFEGTIPLGPIVQKLDTTLVERGGRYGDFTNNARVAQQIREIVRACESWSKMTPVEREALDAIILKISRIVTGDPHYPDNWHDIQGFAKLVEDRLPATP